MTTATPAPAPEDDDRLAGLLAEQTHQYRDLDADSTCCPDGPEFGCRNYLARSQS